MMKEFTAYLDHPSQTALKTLHAALLKDPGFSRATTWLEHAHDLSMQQRHDEVIRLVLAQMPGALLSPVAHGLLSEAFAGIGDQERSRREAYYAHVAVEAILSSGDGTEPAPWQVLQVADEYAALSNLRLEPVGQAVHQNGGRMYDVISCADGSSRYFELVSG